MAGEVRWWNTNATPMNPGSNLFMVDNVAAGSMLTRVEAGIELEWAYTVTGAYFFAGVSILWGIEAFDHGGSPATISAANFNNSSLWIESGRITPDYVAALPLNIGGGAAVEYHAGGRFVWEGAKQLSAGNTADVYVSFSWEGAGFFGVAGNGVISGRASTYSP